MDVCSALYQIEPYQGITNLILLYRMRYRGANCPNRIITVGNCIIHMSDTEIQSESGRQIKVVRLIEEYELGDIGDQLEHQWTIDSDDRMSLRDLADYFNQQLLAEAMADAGMQPLSGEIENVYRLLTADHISKADRTRIRRRLERKSIDVEQLDRDFVTYQAIRTYLKDHRGAEYATDDRPRTDVEVENFQRIRGRTVTVTEGKLDQLVNGDHITLGEFRVLVEINVFCEDCGSQYELIEVLEQGGCGCPRQTKSDE